MKLPLSWLREFVNVEAEALEIARRLTFAGLEVEAVERTAATFDGVFVAKVVDVQRHPNADRLNLCEVDPGDGTRLKIVCGAPNVKTGMMIALARVGARLAASETQPQSVGGSELKSVRPLEAAVIRGVQSEGMICSERELGISGEHGGIMDLGADAPLGASVADFLNSKIRCWMWRCCQIEAIVFRSSAWRGKSQRCSEPGSSRCDCVPPVETRAAARFSTSRSKQATCARATRRWQ